MLSLIDDLLAIETPAMRWLARAGSALDRINDLEAAQSRCGTPGRTPSPSAPAASSCEVK